MTEMPQTPPLRLHARISGTRTLGPFMRYALWVQGCPFRCSGCMTPDAQPVEGGYEYDMQTLAGDILAQPEIEGLTLSGGEPFAQAQVLADLIEYLQNHRNLGVIAYTGYTRADVQRAALVCMNIRRLLARIDLLIDGPYIADLNHGAALVGSANQQIISLTDRYRPHLHLYDTHQPRQVELHVLQGERMLVGIPSAGQLAWWRDYRNRQE